jgi:tRNA dimethylallyltransferase
LKPRLIDNKKPKIIVILGPTSSGKSRLAVGLARRFEGEIISADSRQIYRGLDIGSGKITEKEMRGVPHHLLGIANPKKVFTVSNFKRLANKKIKEIITRNKIPIIVGGTGFYIRAIVHGIVIPKVKPNKKLRRELENKTPKELAQILRKLDYRRWKEIDKKNKRRLIRAIEIAKSLGKVPTLKTKPMNADFKLIGIKVDKNKLAKSVTKRVKNMINNGFINETAQLIKGGVSNKRIRELGFEYQDAIKYINGEIKSKEELANSMTRKTLNYAKRQMTWFKRDKDIIWITDPREAYAIVRDFLAL